MKKKLLFLLLLLFALFGVIIVVPRILDGTLPIGPTSGAQTAETRPIETETMADVTFPYETAHKDGETEQEEETEPTEYDPGDPIDREKIVTDLIFASDMHYMSRNLTDYGKAFTDLEDNGDGRVVRYMTEIWQAFSEEVISARPDALILSGDLTLNGEKVNHQEFAQKLAEIEAAGIRVLVIPGNHDINNPYATSYFGGSQSSVETVTPEEFRKLYGSFGYDEAVSHAPDSLSYLYILNETTWMMMLDSCIYDPDNEVDGEIKEGTLKWMEQCLREAYAQGITVIPVAHHNLQELSSVYREECVIRNHEEVLEMLERYLTPVFFSGHLHVQRIMKHTLGPGAPAEVYGIKEVVSNSLIIPPCQYGRLTLNADGSMSYHANNTNISGWAAKHGLKNEELLNFTAYSEAYVQGVISRQIYSGIDHIPDEIKETMAQFYANLYRDYYAGRTMNYEIIRLEPGYQMWNRYLSTTVQFRQLEGMMRDGMAVNNNVEIPDPVHQIWE